MNIIIYFGTLVTLIIIDSVWLLSTGSFYKKWLGNLFDFSVSLVPAAVFYLIYTLGVLFFVIIPSIQKESGWVTVLITGALFGAVAYATYDLTNQATIRNWPVMITLMDIAWGAIMTGISSCIVYLVYAYFK
jgi:uncharacterized membrane protein